MRIGGRRFIGNVDQAKLKKIAAKADPERNPNEHERAVASNMVATFKAHRPPGLPPEPPPLPTNSSGWIRKGKTKKSDEASEFETKKLAIINAPSIYPEEAQLPTHPSIDSETQAIRYAIATAKKYEPEIIKLGVRDLNTWVWTFTQKIQTYSFPEIGDGRVTGPIDEKFVDWSKNVAAKVQARRAIIDDRKRRKDAQRATTPQQSQLSDRVAVEHLSDSVAILKELNERRAAKRALKRASLKCQSCGNPLTAQRATARYCNATCRSRVWRAS